jgi:hypothetical protein
LNQPNDLPNKLQEAPALWRGDIGDLMAVKEKSEAEKAELIAGTSAIGVDDHGVIVVCKDGRMILQTFSSHDFSMQDMVQLWQNYVYNVLENQVKITTNFDNLPPQAASSPEDHGENAAEETSLDGTEQGIGVNHFCGEQLLVKVPSPPRFIKDMFEHHAVGTFLLAELEIKNLTGDSIRIWDSDYAIESSIAGEQKLTYPDKAATGYLYIENPVNLSQDSILPGGTWKTMLAFDVDPKGEDWVLKVTPGEEGNEAVCSVRIPLTR